MQLYEAFHFAQNSGRKSKGVRGRGLNALETRTTETFFPLFSTFITPL